MEERFRITIKAARINAGKSLDEAAKELGINKRTLINYEKGATSPGWDMIDKFCSCYSVPVDHLKLKN